MRDVPGLNIQPTLYFVPVSSATPNNSLPSCFLSSDFHISSHLNIDEHETVMNTERSKQVTDVITPLGRF